MFEVGKRYWARNGDFSVKVRCVGRAVKKVTFITSPHDAAYLGTKTKFSKMAEKVGISGKDGMQREIVRRVGDRHPSCDWTITDVEAPF